MIDYPDDAAIRREAEAHGLLPPVLVRDLVRIVEVLNLDGADFFGRQSVLAGSMALRCFRSPRFTVYDADFSTTEDGSPRPDEMRRLLTYADDDLEIRPARLTPHDERGTAWKSEPIEYSPIFTTLAPDVNDRRFKADISFRGLVCDGIQTQLLIPYTLNIWAEPPTVWIMDPHEIVAEKVLGWCANRLVKHYADLGFIALASRPGPNRLVELDAGRLREVLAGKLEIMRGLQPGLYAAYSSVDGLVDELAESPVFDRGQWQKIVYLRAQRDQFSQELIAEAVSRLLVPMLRSPRR